MPQAFTVNNLSPGVYRVEVAVSDGEFESRAGVLLTVEAPPKPKPQDEPTFTVAETIGLILLVVIVIILLAVALVYVSRGGEKEGPEPDIISPEAPLVAEVPATGAEPSEWVADEDDET